MNISGKHRISGEKIYKAAELLMDYLSDGEKPSIDAKRLATEHGISEQTFNRARRALGIRSRKSGGSWYMYAPEAARECFASCDQPSKAGFLAYTHAGVAGVGAVSSDWVAVIPGIGESERRIEVPTNESKAGLRVKVGAYEFEADAGFPMEKLAVLLRGLGGEGLC